MTVFWLGWQDSNLRMPESKSGALPLGYIPITPTEAIIHIIQLFVNGKMYFSPKLQIFTFRRYVSNI